MINHATKIFLLFGLFCSVYAQSLNPTGGGGMHDPVMIKEDNTYYIYATTGSWTSTDMKRWSRGKGFVPRESWQSQTIPGFQGYWAPDISYRDGKFWLYYSMSTFGSNKSAIGLATASTLKDWSFQDQGLVVKSPVREEGDHNAIDPNAIEDGKGNVYLNWGSWRGGIFIRQLDPATGKPLDTAKTINIAQNRSGIEGPFIIRTRGYFYLFVSWDLCCKGMESTYNIRTGRSKNVIGPYLDKSGKDMLDGGGDLLDDGSDYAGGHNGVFEEDGKFYVMYQQYQPQGTDLEIMNLYFDKEDWPTYDHSQATSVAVPSIKKELLLPSSLNYPLSFTPKEDCQFTLYNLQGKNLLTKQLSSNQKTNFPDIKPGSYCIQLNSKKSSYKQHIVVF